MIIELAGLPGAGKTTRATQLQAQHNLRVVQLPKNKFLLFLEGFFTAFLRPKASFLLLMLIAREKNFSLKRSLFINTWLGSNIKYWRARNGGIIDQGYVQALIAMLPQARDTFFIEGILRGVPPGVYVEWCETSPVTRLERLHARVRMPREEFGEEATHRFKVESEGAYVLVRAHAESIFGKKKGQSKTHLLLKTVSMCFAYAIRSGVIFFTKRPEAVVLMYHAIDRSPHKLSVAPDTFEKQMVYIANKGWAIPLEDLVQYAKSQKEIPRRSVAVTFDDGYKDLITTVFPIIEKYRVPITIFIPSDFSVSTNPLHTTRLTKEELQKLATSPLVTVASHGQTHKKLPDLSLFEMKREAEDSMHELQRLFRTPIRYFAYPYGARSLHAEQAVGSAGYEAAFGITERTLQKSDHIFALPRVQVDSTMSHLLFRLRLSSAVDWHRKMVDFLRNILHAV